MIKGKISRFNNRLHKIQKETNTNYVSILQDFNLLKQKLNICFYEYYCFYLDDRKSYLRETFLSKINKTKFLEILNPRTYYILARNKYVAHLFFDSTTIQRSELYLYYNPLVLKTDRICTNSIEIIEKLKDLQISKFVIKTTESSHGEGVFVVTDIKFIEQDLILVFINGTEKKLTDFLTSEPLIFEKLIEQTSQFKAFNPTSVNTVRFMTNLHPSGEVSIIGCFIKIGRLGSWVDNAGSGGNICANVNVKTGVISNVIEFNGWRNIKYIQNHTDTHTPIENVKIENWDLICEQVKSYQKQMPFLKAIGWDVAITDQGAVIIEMNDFWDETGQLFIGEGWSPAISKLYNQWKNEYKKTF